MPLHDSAYSVLLTFGKFKGRTLGELYHSNKSYLEWMAGAEGVPDYWRTLCSKVLLGEPIDVGSAASAPKTVKATFKAIRNSKIAITFDYDIQTIARFKDTIDAKRWNKEERQWEVSSEQLPKLVEFFGQKNINADEKTKKLYFEEIERRAQLDAIRTKEDSDIVVGTKLDLYPYQKVAVEFIERAEGRAMVADQMGLGKTATAIGYAVYHNLKTLIICPKSVKPNWAREINRFAGKTTCMWESTTHTGRTNSQFHVINYDIVQKNITALRKLDFDLLVCDEATYLKNYKSGRTKSILGSYKERRKYPGIKTKHVIFLTGTPILNRPIEAFTLLSFLDKNRFSNPAHFMQRYGGSGEGAKAQNLDELFERTKDLVIRRLKSQVASELPPKQRFDLMVELTSAEKKAYHKHLTKLFKKWKLNGHPSAAHMPEIRNYLFDLKFPRIVEFVDEMIGSDRPVLVFTIHQEHAYRIAQQYGENARVITGQTSSDDRQEAITDLSNGTAQVGVFTIGAGSMGIDGLQHKIDATLFVDYWWVPAIHEQAEDRTHRKGQTNQVQIWYLKAEGTYDEHMANVLQEKQSIIDKAVDGQEMSVAQNTSIFMEVVRRMAREYQEDVGNIEDSEETE